MGLFGGSSSSSATTTNFDNRIAVEDGIGVSGNNSSVVINSLDGAIISDALDTVESTNNHVIDVLSAGIKTMFDNGQALIGTTQKTVADAYAQATSEKAGTLDNKTILMLGLAAFGLIGIYFVYGKK